jgi:hypothetical protein
MEIKRRVTQSDIASIENADFMEVPKQATHQLAMAGAKGEDQLLAEVLQAHLGRLVTTDDFKDCQLKFRQGYPDEYVFAYKGVDLGLVRRELKMEPLSNDDFVRNEFTISYTISFRPVKKQ